MPACSKYLQDSKLTTTESAPLRNLSAALYELGKYKECLAITRKASERVKTEARDDKKAQLEKLD